MDRIDAVITLAALAQETRLDIYRRLVETGPDGLAAGKIAEILDLPSATLSFHLSQLRNARLIGSRRESRSIIYHADYHRMNDLLIYLTYNCCQGHAEVCGPLVEALVGCGIGDAAQAQGGKNDGGKRRRAG
ncbi:MAG: metalloregulator ArsR/SmtB family transcription factor [Alphaproteobacteria bacterium]